MNLFLGITLFEVKYSVGEQRMLFELDALVLRAIARERIDTVETLEAAFQIPRTMMMEVLLRLFDDAWIAVPARTQEDASLSQRLVGTPRTEEWLASDLKHLPSPSRFELFKRTIAREQLLGGLSSRRNLGAVQSAENLLGKDGAGAGFFLPTPFAGAALDESAVRQHVSVPSGRFFEGVQAVQQRYQPLYLTLSFDVETGRIGGLPRIWERRLVEPIRAALMERALWTPNIPSPVVLGQADLRWERTPESDLQWLDRSTLFPHIQARLHGAVPKCRFAIVVEELSVEVLSRLEPGITAAIEGGASVDIIWGTAADGVQEWLARFGKDDEKTPYVNRNHYQAAIHADCFLEVKHDPVLMNGEGRLILGTRHWMSNGCKESCSESFLGAETRCLPTVVEACQYLSTFIESMPGEGFEKPPASAWRFVGAELNLVNVSLETSETSAGLYEPAGRVALLRDFADRNSAIQMFVCAREEGRTWFLESLTPGEQHVIERSLKLVGGSQPSVRIITSKAGLPLAGEVLSVRSQREPVPDGLATAGSLVLLMGLNSFVGDPYNAITAFELAFALEGFRDSAKFAKCFELTLQPPAAE